MYIKPNIERIRKLDITNFKSRETVLFCPECPWQTDEPGVGMKPVCTDCGSGLHTFVVPDGERLQ